MKKKTDGVIKRIVPLMLAILLITNDFYVCGNVYDYSLTAEAASTVTRPLIRLDITSAKSFVYDGTQKKVTVQPYDNYMFAVPSAGYTVSGNAYTNAGTYTVKATGKGTVVSSTGVAYAATVQANWTITKASNPLSYASSQSVSKTFSTSAQTATLTAATKNQGSLSYSISSQKNSSGTAVNYFSLSGTTLTIGANTPAGTYTVVTSAYAGGNSNYYSGSKNSTVTVTVNKAPNPLTYTSTQSVAKTFSTSAQTATLTAATNNQGTLSYSIASQKNSSGTAVNYFTLSGTTLTVAANTPAGTYTVAVNATAAGNGNYNSGTKTSTVTVTIGKADNSLAYLPTQSVTKTFSKDSQTASLTAATNNQGNLSYALASQKDYSGNTVNYFSVNGTTLTIAGSTPPGTYNVAIAATAAGNTNYYSATKTSNVTVTINKLSNTLEYTSAQSVTKTYSTAAQTATLAAATGSQGTLSYAIASQKNSSGSDVSHFTLNGTTLTIAANTPAGVYTVVINATSAGDSTYNGVTKSSTVTVKVNKAANPLTYTATQSVAKKHSTTAQTATLTAATKNEGAVTYAIASQKNSSGTEVNCFALNGTTLTIAANTPVGTYTVAVNATAAGNNNYNSGTKTSTVTVMVNKLDFSPSVTITGWTYGSAANSPSVSGNTSGGSVTYQYKAKNAEDSTYQSEVPTEAGDYTVKATVAATEIYNSASATANFTISKATATVTDPKAKSLVYSENPQELIEAGSTTGGTMLYSTDGKNYSTDIPTKTDAGTYTVYYKVDGGNNYNDVPAKQLTVKIEKADPEVPAPTPNTLTYDGTDQELITPPQTDDGTVLYSLDGENYSEEIPTGKDQGKYTVYYKLEGDNNHNDDPVGGSVTVVINKANPTVNPPKGLSLTFNGTTQELIEEGTTNVGTMLYSLYEDGEFSEAIPCKAAPGTYTVYYKVVCNDDNYNDVPATPVTAVINKQAPEVVPPTGRVLDYNGSMQVLINAGSTTGGTMMYSLDNQYYTADVNSIRVKRKNVGTYNIYYKVVGNGTYGDVPAETVVATINKAEPSVTDPTPLVDLTYNGKNQVLVNPGAVPSGCTILYSLDDENYSTELPTGLEARPYDPYPVYYKVDGGNNYLDVETQVVYVTIDKAEPDVTPPTAIDLTYSGEEQELVIPAETSDGTVYYSLDGEDYSTEIPKADKVGEYEVYYIVIGDDNYDDTEPQSVIVTIKENNKENLTVKFNSNGGTSVDDQTVKYNSTATEPNNPFRSGYTFLGWYYNGQLYNFSTAVKEDIVLEAKWKSTNELIKGNSATFNEALDFNFFAKISKDSLDGAYVLFKYEHYGIPKELKVMADPNNMRGSYYRFACPLMSSELTVDVTAELYVNGSTEPVSTWTRNVRNFCIAGMNDPNTPEEEKNVLRATLNYGGYSQERFNQNTNLVIANKDYEDSVENVTVKSTITQNRPYESVKGLEYVGSSVFLVNVPYLRYYFRIVDDSASISDFTFTVNGTEYVPTLDSSGYYYFETAPVYAFLLDQPQRVIVKKGNAKVFDFNNSIIKWAETAASEENGKDQNIAKALFVYYEAAKAFAEYKSNGGE